VKAGEEALRPLEERLAQLTGISDLKIVAKVEESKSRRASKYAMVINVVQWTMVVAFMIGALYAAAWPIFGAGSVMSQAGGWALVQPRPAVHWYQSFIGTDWVQIFATDTAAECESQKLSLFKAIEAAEEKQHPSSKGKDPAWNARCVPAASVLLR
jgi:hypothetical protein